MVNEDAHATARFVDATVQVSCEVAAYCACIYGPVINITYMNPGAIFNLIFHEAIMKASNYKGPAVIVGDFNIEIDNFPPWIWLQKQGWQDAALLAFQLFGWEPEMTTKGATRRSSFSSTLFWLPI